MTLAIRFLWDDDSDTPRRSFEGVADHSGAAAIAIRYRRNGQIVFRMAATVSEQHLPANNSHSQLARLRRLRDLMIARYRTDGRCSPIEMRTVQALFVEGLTLREFARREGVAAQAIDSRINGLAHKAPEFYRWWRIKHQSRRRR